MKINLRELLSTPVSAPEWIVEGFLPRGSRIILAGEAGIGKSLVSYNLAFSVATGQPFFGMPTAPRTVLYVDQENGRPDHTRYMHWVYNGNGPFDMERLEDNLHIESLSLSRPDRIAQIGELATKYRPQLIVIDTVNSALNIQNENDNSEAMRLLHQLREVEAVSDNPSVVLLKHAKIDPKGETGPMIRGAKGWKDNTDGSYFHLPGPGAPPNDPSLRRTQIIPDKIRAYGLRTRLHILPGWVNKGSKHEGLRLAVD
jgi:RecA-family ATPase